MDKKIEFEEGLWEELADAVLEMDEDRVINAAVQVVQNNYSAEDAMIKGLAEGMGRAGERFAKDIYFVPEILMCADAMNAGFEVLKDHGLKTIHAKGQKFDPRLHEALLTESSEDGEDEIVAEEWRKGYLFNDRLLRPAQVKVLKTEKVDDN